MEAGYGKRIMFGSDASMWPQTLAIGIEAVESADFLSEAQRRDIFYNNAARFLRLNEKGNRKTGRARLGLTRTQDHAPYLNSGVLPRGRVRPALLFWG